MKKIKIFLASSNELIQDRERFEIEVYRKCKLWIDKGIFLNLIIWEDLSARLSSTRSQDEYNKQIFESDLFVLLAHTKIGMYTQEEFLEAQGKFQEEKKPFVFTYFKQVPPEFDEETQNSISLKNFKDKLTELGHFYASYQDSNDLWNQFNKELERLEAEGFERNERNEDVAKGKIITQTAEKIYNIENIDKADFS